MAAGLSAGTITSLSPSSLSPISAEEFLTVNGSSLGDRVRFSGPAGTFELDINARINSSVVTWIPLEVLRTPGKYDVTVLGGNSGDSGPEILTITGGLKIPHLVLVLPEFFFIESKYREGMVIKYDATAFGGEDPEPIIDCNPVSGSVFRIGTTNVKCVATNRYGERSEDSFAVSVSDAPPILSAPEQLVVETKDDGAVVDYRVTASDVIDGETNVDCAPRSGSFFRIGKTAVLCSTQDSAANVSTGSFIVDVQDASGIFKIHVPESLTAEADLPEGMYVSFDVWTSGTEDPEPEVKCDPASESLFPFDFTSVYCVASDKFGARAENKFEVNVIDTTPPIITTAAAEPDFISPNGEMVPIRLNLQANDAVDPNPRCVVVDITANEPIDPDDWKIVSESEIAVRGVSKGETDRIYRVNVHCNDFRENRSSAIANVTVSDEKE